MAIELGIWEIAVLALLREAPMHPYQMQRLLKLRHKDEILALKRGSLYHAIRRLQAAGSIEAAQTTRDGRRPERTTYRITAEGREQFIAVLHAIVASPRRESSEFLAAMSFLVHLDAADAVQKLEQRCRALEAQIDEQTRGLAAASAHVLPINLVESEYLVAMLRAELAWVRSLVEDVRSGKLQWNTEQILRDVQRERESTAHAAKEQS